MANFRRVELLGSGSYGDVYKAEWKGQLVAAKVLHESLFLNEYVSKFEEECRILRRLDHKNIVKVLAFEKSHSSPPVLITELLDRDLEKYVKSLCPEKIPFPETVSIMLDVAEGLAYLHGRDPPIVHRDLACKNVLLTGKRQAKIADLGLAKVFSPNERKQYASPVPGTQVYAAPETFPPVAYGNAPSPTVEYDAKIDIFSFGVMLMEVINGSSPITKPDSPFTKDGRRIPEKERRRSDIRKMDEHKLRKIVPLREIVLQCIDDSSEKRPSAAEVSEWLRIELSKIEHQKRNIADNKKCPTITISVLGQSNVGKSCLISRFVDHSFIGKVDATCGMDVRCGGINLHGKEFRLHLVDTAGSERFNSIFPNLIRHVQGVVLVFDITNRSSFEDAIPQMLAIVENHAPDYTSLILVGNKADLADQDALKREREIAKEEAEQFAQQLRIRYVETSALSGQNIEEVFELISKDIYDTLDLSDIEIGIPGAPSDAGSDCC